MVKRAVVQSTHWYELRGHEKHREEMQTERWKETGKERKGGETPTHVPHSRGTQKMHYHGCCDVFPSGPSPRGPSPLASLFQSAASWQKFTSTIGGSHFVFYWSSSWLHFIASDSVACCPLTVQMSQGCQDLQNLKETPLLIFPPY